MIASVLVAAPKFNPPAGIPPITPGSVVIVKRSQTFSSFATLAIPSGIPIPKLTTLLAINSNDARRAITFFSFKAMEGIDPAEIRSSLANPGLYGSANVCQWFSGFATTTQSTRIPGIFTWRGLRVPDSAMRSTWAITMPPEVTCGHCDGERFQLERLFSIGASVGVRGCATHDGNVHWKKSCKEGSQLHLSI